MVDPIPDPDRTIPVIEPKDSEGALNPPATVPIEARNLRVHTGRRSNSLFYDGHAKALRAIETIRPIDHWSPEPVERRTPRSS